MNVKLLSLAQDLNVGIKTLADFLEVNSNPNVRIDKDQFDRAMGRFGSNFSKEQRLHIIEKYKAPMPANLQKEDSPKGGAAASAPQEAENKGVSSVEVRGHIELGQFKKKNTPPSKEAKPVAPIAKEKEEKSHSSATEPKSSATEKKEVAPKSEHTPEVAPTKEQRATTAPNRALETTQIAAAAEKAPSTKEATLAPKTLPSEQEKKPLATDSAQPSAEAKKDQQKKDAENPSPAGDTKEATASHHIAQGSKQSAPTAPKIESKKEEAAIAQKPADTIEKAPEAEEQEVSKEQKRETSVFRFDHSEEVPQFKVVDKIDLSSINDSTRKKKNARENRQSRRKRINKGAVDINAEAAKGVNSKQGAQQKNKNKSNKPQGQNPQGQPAQQRPQNERKKKRNKQKEPERVEVSQEDIDRQVREVRARIAAGKKQSLGKAENRKQKREMQRLRSEQEEKERAIEQNTIKITEFVTVSDLANLMHVPVNEVIATCMSIDMMVSINMRLEADTIKLIAEEFGYNIEFVSADVVEAIQADDQVDEEKDLVERPPVVTVMGHVDHGKTSLLDTIRKTNVVSGEAGGITQHIATYSVTLKNGRKITFLDTPGHQAFTAMRARGAKATDIVIIIVDATSAVMPQTIEALNHASAAGVPIIFAINKVDHPNAKPDQIKEQLAQQNYLVEEWGGKYQSQEISAKFGQGVRELLDKVLLEADILELKANPNRNASGIIIESSLDKGRGYVAKILVANGTLHVGDMVLAGKYFGRVKALTDEFGNRLKEVGPSMPATLLGLDGAPSAGDDFNVLTNEKEAGEIARRRRQLDREQGIRTQQRLTLEDIGRRIKIGNFKELNLIIKGDVDGSIEALADSLIRLSTEEIAVRVIHKGVGQITESDIELAKASNAIIIGFQVRPGTEARKSAERSGVEIRTYSVIYDTIDDVKAAMEGMLSPEVKEQVTASLEVKQAFFIKGVGTIAGCMVLEGKIKRSDKVRVIRDGIVIHTGKLGSLKRFKDDAKEVPMGLECGLNIDGYNDVKEGDMLESFTEFEVKKTL